MTLVTNIKAGTIHSTIGIGRLHADVQFIAIHALLCTIEQVTALVNVMVDINFVTNFVVTRGF